MNKIDINNIVPFRALHVGEILLDELKARNMRQSDLVRLTGISKPILNDIIKCRRRLTPEMALLVEEAIDIPAITLMKIQVEYELNQAKLSEKVITQKKHIKVWRVLRNYINTTKLKKEGVIDHKNIADDIKKIFTSVGVDNIEDYISKIKV